MAVGCAGGAWGVAAVVVVACVVAFQALDPSLGDHDVVVVVAVAADVVAYFPPWHVQEEEGLAVVASEQSFVVMAALVVVAADEQMFHHRRGENTSVQGAHRIRDWNCQITLEEA